MISRLINTLKRNNRKALFIQSFRREYSQNQFKRGKNHNDKAAEHMLYGLESRRRIRNERDLRNYADILFNGFLSLKQGRANPKNFYSVNRNELSAASEQYISKERVYTMNEQFIRRLDRLGHEFGTIFGMLNTQFENLVISVENSRYGRIDNKTYFVMLGIISKLIKSINRFPNFILKKKNLEESYKLAEITNRLAKCTNLNPGQSKKAGNMVISVLANQFLLIHMMEELDPKDPLRQSFEDGFPQKLRNIHHQILDTAMKNNIDIDSRGLSGVYIVRQQLSDHETDFHQKIIEHITQKIGMNINGYPGNFDFSSFALTYNKLVNYREKAFLPDVKKCNKFIFEKFYPDYKNQKLGSLDIQFKNMTALFWGMTRYVTQNKEVEMRNQLKTFFIDFVKNWDNMEITDYDFLSINMFVDSMVRLNCFDNESSLKIQKQVLKNFNSRRVDGSMFKCYIDFHSLILSSNTEIDPQVFKNSIQKIESSTGEVFPRTMHDVCNYLSSSSLIKSINKKNPKNLTEREKLTLESMKGYLNIFMNAFLKNPRKYSFVSLMNLYRNYIEFNRKRNVEFEQGILKKSKLVGEMDYVLTVIELDIIISEIREIHSSEVIHDLVENYDYEQLFMNDMVYESGINFHSVLKKINTINYNLRKSQITRNLNEYPHIEKFVVYERKFLEKFLEKFDQKSVKKMLKSRMEVSRFATFLHEYFQTELRFGHENSQIICKNIMQIISEFEFSSQLDVYKPICISSSALTSLLEDLQSRLSFLIQNQSYINSQNLQKILNLVSLKSFFNDELHGILKEYVKKSLTEDNNYNSFDALLSQFLFLEEVIVCYGESNFIREKVSLRLEHLSKKYFNLLLAETRGSIKINFMYKSVTRLIHFFKVSDVTEEQKKRAELAEENLEKIISTFEEEVGNAVQYKDYLYTNLQNKTKEVLEELNLGYKEETYIGPFLVDFLLPELKTIIEVTGPIHFVAKSDELNLRTKFKVDILRKSGYKVITLRNEDLVESMDAKKATLARMLNN